MESQLVKIWCHRAINGEKQEYVKPPLSHRTGFPFPLPNPSFTKGYFFLLEGKPYLFLSTNAECRFLLFPSKHCISPSGLNNISLRSEVITLTTQAAHWTFGGPWGAPGCPGSVEERVPSTGAEQVPLAPWSSSAATMEKTICSTWKGVWFRTPSPRIPAPSPAAVFRRAPRE